MRGGILGRKACIYGTTLGWIDMGAEMNGMAPAVSGVAMTPFYLHVSPISYHSCLRYLFCNG